MMQHTQSKIFDIVLAFLIFVPTVAVVSNNRLFVVAVVVCAFRWTKTGVKLLPADVYVFIFLGIAYLNLFTTLITGELRPSSRDVGIATMFITVLVGRTLSSRCADWLTVFITIEAVVCVVERVLGVPTLFPTFLRAQAQAGAAAIFSQDGVYLYHTRVLGLSVNSSVAAEKLLLGVLLLHQSKWSFQIRLFMAVCLAGGFYATFNRTDITAAGLFLFLILSDQLVNPNVKRSRRLLGVMVLAVLICGLYTSSQAVYEQFVRGHHSKTLVEDSGRLDIFADAFQFWSAHPVRGNGSVRYSRLFGGGILGHVHNSFLQVLCDHGLIAFLLWAYFFTQINRRNWKYAIPLLFHSTFQYGMFWNISILDITMYYLFWSMRRPETPRRPSFVRLAFVGGPGQPVAIARMAGSERREYI